MAYIHPDVLDNGLQELTDDVDAIYFCSAEPTSYAEAVTYTLGSKTSPTVGAPEDHTAGGRKVVVAAISDGSASAAGTITHYALVDSGASKLLAVQAVDEPVVVAISDVITTPSFNVGIPGAV